MEAIFAVWKLIPTWARFLLCGFILGNLTGAYGMHLVHNAFEAGQKAVAASVIERLDRKQNTAVAKVETKAVSVDQENKLKERVIYKQVIKYVPTKDDPGCPNLTVGTVRVLNAARSAQTVADVVRATAGLTDEESRALTSLSRIDLVVSDAEIALMYNDLASKHNLLVDAIDAQQKAIGNH